MHFQKLILILIVNALFSSYLCKPSKGIENIRISRRLKQTATSDTCIYMTTYFGLHGVCVPYHLCVNGYVVTMGANLFAPRLASEDGGNGRRFCGESEKCCRLRYDEDINEYMTTDEESLKDEDLPLTNQLDDLGDNSDYTYNEILEYTDDWRPKCGVRNFNVLQPRITGEETAEKIELPWMVAVMKKSPTSKYQCGGSLIHPSVVLTAAHCVAKIRTKSFYIRAGEWDMQNTDEILPHQDREIQSMIIHDDYNNSTLTNDIAILILKLPVELAENVNTICLPPPNYSFDNERCLVSGWGKDHHKGKFQFVLKKVELPIIPNNMCETMLRKTVLGSYFRLDNTFLCAGAEYGKDSCKGDGGSPLVCRISNTSNSYYQSGIVSWGIGCKKSNIPGAYVNVARYREWIDKVMSMRNLEHDWYIY